MNHLLSQWKIFAVCTLIGVLAAFGMRSRQGAAPKAPMPGMGTSVTPKERPLAKSTGLLVDLGNTICPINEGAVDGETYVEWNNLRVAFCCPGCDTQFLKDPEAALAKAGIEWKELGEAISRFQSAPAEHKQHQLGALRKRWTVIREP